MGFQAPIAERILYAKIENATKELNEEKKPYLIVKQDGVEFHTDEVKEKGTILLELQGDKVVKVTTV